ncbi:galactose ABC transporter substrate-binding protein [Oscillospiraceae bacterium]|uniref:galactose ABC transporter substrate-binding protein n=2 Tax=Allofournierella sp. TaxID=1940256 RepID=UPI0015AF9EEC|nr:galactose ABC transporter substrate-binding protein [Oscillospiraceae bacterium]
MKKKLALVLAAALMLAVLAGCGGTPAPSTPAASNPASMGGEPAAPASDLNAAVFYYNYSDVYISSVRNNMDEMLKGMGVKYDNYDGAGNQAQQTDQINTAITNGANLLIVNIVETSSPDAAQNAVEAARGAGIPIIFFNREVQDDVVNSYDKCAFVGTDAPEAGHMQGALIGQYLLDNYDALDLNGDGTISYVMFKGQEGNAEAEARTQFGVEDADAVLTAAGKPALAFYDANNSAKYLVDQNGSWSAAAATNYMDTILAEYSEANKNMIELVIANNDDMALGAVASLQTAGYNLGEGKTIPVFGVDAIDSAKQAIDEGKMTGTIMQDAVGMAKTITALVGNVQSGAELMNSIDEANGYNVDKNDDGTVKVNKIRVPYGVYTGK